jgi:iron complex outermembrane receptor protein
LTAEFEYQNYRYNFFRDFPPESEFLDIPTTRILGEPDFSDTTAESIRGSYIFEYDFSDTWKFRQGFNAIANYFDARFVQDIDLLAADRRTLPREATKRDEYEDNFTLQNEIAGEFETFSINHQALLGVEISRNRANYDVVAAPIASIDILDPVYGAQPGTFEPSFASESSLDTTAVYLQDLVEIVPQLKILGGVRLDWADLFFEDLLTDETINEFTEFTTSPRAGITYQPTPSTSLYASWSRSFNPQVFERSRTDEAFDPERGEQFEVGLKQEFLDGKLSSTLALFDITKENVLTTDPVDSDFSVQTGEQKSRGIELDISGEILPGWNVLATYAYTDAYVSEDNEIPIGDALPGAAEHSASVWTTYGIQKGDFKGLGAGIGLYFVGDREVELPNSVEIPSYLRADASIFYRRKNYEFNLNFKNITDTRYYETQGFYIVPQAPFSVLGTFSLKF